MYKRSMLVLLFLLLFAGGRMLYGCYLQQQAEPLDAAQKPEEMKTASITVYVSGAVNHPGVVSLAEGTRAADAVEACGGVLAQADLEAVNMAQVLKDGQQLRIPERRLDDGAVHSGSAVKDGIIHINTADEKALDTLPGIGPAMAKRILEYRTEHGGFQTIEELRKVRGIGAAKYDKLKERIAL